MITKKIRKRCVAAGMASVMAMVFALNPLSENRVQAAAAKTTYIKTLKVFSKEGAAEKDAEAWCAEQEENKDKDKTNDWAVIPGNLNEGASGTLKKEVGVFLVYQTTTDAKEAITDIALMNEQGNYSEGEYQMLLEEQKDLYKDMVDDMKDMLEEYRVNVANNVPTALQAQKFLNGYIEDDSGKRLGDLLLDISDEDLVQVLLQANGQVVMAVQDKLAYACDTGKTTWLERMEKIGSYKALRAKALKAYNNNTSKADKALKKKYQEKAQRLSASWEDINQHIKHYRKIVEQNGIDKMSDEEFAAWYEKNKEDKDVITYQDEAQLLVKLASYKYEDATLLEFFEQDYEDVTGKNLTKLYPLVECLTDGQLAGVDETVSLFTLIMNASAADAYNNYDSDASKELEKSLSEQDKKDMDEVRDEMEDALDAWQENAEISVYDGVDREIIEGGVAVTSTAKDYSNGSEKNWADAIVESNYFMPASIGVLAGAAVFTAGAIVCAHYYSSITMDIMKDEYDKLLYIHEAADTEYECVFADGYTAAGKGPGTNDVVYRYGNAEEGVKVQSAAGKKELLEKAMESNPREASMAKVLNGLKIGFTVAAILLAVADIVMTGITLYKYYNREHLPIPHHMVDLTYNEDKESSYIAYKSVPDQDGNCGDLNGGGGKQWLAIYATHDEDAGDPILAPAEGSENFILQKKSSKAPKGDYSPLHMFGSFNTAQNLTYADGENGWSYNDKMGGIYLYFKRDENPFTRTEDTTVTAAGTIMASGNVALAGGAGVFVGLLAGILGSAFVRRRKRK